MVKISAVIITYNEEKDIARAIESVNGIADEVLVVDSFSTDKTQEICESMGAKFIQNKFEGHIQQKNFAALQAKYDYVLSLDADEALDNTLRKNILNAKNNFNADGYKFNRLTNYCGKWIKHCGWYPDTKLRLWDRRKGEWGGDNPHDKYIMNEGSIIKHLKGNILHYSYHTIHQHIAQANKFSNIGALSSFNKGRKMSLVKIVVFPFWKFLNIYLFRGGFLDGYYGFIICMISTHESFLKYVKLRELNKGKKLE